jgi:hypothetical protein
MIGAEDAVATFERLLERGDRLAGALRGAVPDAIGMTRGERGDVLPAVVDGAAAAAVA